MHPILLKLGPLTLYSYGAMLVVAFLAAAGLAGRTARRSFDSRHGARSGCSLPPALVAINADQLVDFACYSLLGGILGARLLYVFLQWDAFLREPWEIPAIWHGGLVWYGGFLGATLAGWLYARAKQLTFLRVMDQVIPFLALGHAIGRLGCFLNGCCFGKPTDAWCGVVFPGQGVRVYPTQLFESAGLFLLYAVLRSLQRPVMLARPGRLLGWYLLCYGGLRFGIEFFRGDQAVWWAGLTLQQGISLGVMGAGLILSGARWRGHISS